MNIKDVEQVPEVRDRLEAIFNKQKELIVKYKKIEGMPDFPMPIDSKESQKWFKDFFWRCTEELMEAWECAEDEDSLHFKEEIADALHFLVEAFIISGVEVSMPDTIPDNLDKLDILFENTVSINYSKDWQRKTAIFDVVYCLGMCGNTLKNKPWKQSQVLTDINKFHFNMNKTLIYFIKMCKTLDITAQELYELYFRKSMVNQFRQRSNY